LVVGRRVCYSECPMKLDQKLQELGLSENEAAVYLTLAKSGPSKAGPIVRETKLHRALVYNALERLNDAGLVTIVREKNVQVFQPNAPEAIRKRVAHVQQIANEVIPELQRLLDRRQPTVEVRTLIGREGFMTNLYDMLEAAERSVTREICILGGAGSHEANPFDVTGEFYPDYVATSKDKKIKKRLIATSKYRELYEREYAIHPNNQLRLLDEGLSSPSFTRITEEMVSIEVYKPEVLILQIRHPQIARSYLDTFQALWKKAKSV